MNITRDVISDLWPVYVAGEASADTRAFIDEFLHEDSEFARLLHEKNIDELLKTNVPPLPPDREVQALKRTRRLLYGWDWLLFMAMVFSCFAFGRIVSDTSWDVSPRNFIIIASIAAIFWVAFFTRLLWTRRQVLRNRAR